jgi:hypothetical protein
LIFYKKYYIIYIESKKKGKIVMKISKDDLSDLGCGGLILVILLIFALAFGIMCFEAWIAMLIWNCVVVALFATLPIISFWQTFLILMLINIVFSGLKSAIRTRD